MASSPVSSKSREVMEVLALPDLKRWTNCQYNATHLTHALRLTLAGRKLDMTSLTFCVGGPAGGGGGPGVAAPVTMLCSGRRYVCNLERALKHGRCPR